MAKSQFFRLFHYYLIFNQASEAFIEDTMGRLSLVSDGGEALASADLVVEAITENLPLKQVNRLALIFEYKKNKIPLLILLLISKRFYPRFKRLRVCFI